MKSSYAIPQARSHGRTLMIAVTISLLLTAVMLIIGSVITPSSTSDGNRQPNPTKQISPDVPMTMEKVVEAAKKMPYGLRKAFTLNFIPTYSTMEELLIKLNSLGNGVYIIQWSRDNLVIVIDH